MALIFLDLDVIVLAPSLDISPTSINNHNRHYNWHVLMGPLLYVSVQVSISKAFIISSLTSLDKRDFDEGTWRFFELRQQD